MSHQMTPKVQCQRPNYANLRTTTANHSQSSINDSTGSRINSPLVSINQRSSGLLNSSVNLSNTFQQGLPKMQMSPEIGTITGGSQAMQQATDDMEDFSHDFPFACNAPINGSSANKKQFFSSVRRPSQFNCDAKLAFDYNYRQRQNTRRQI